MTAQRCAEGLKKKLDLRSGSQRHRHFIGFFNVPAPSTDAGPTLIFMVIPRQMPLNQQKCKKKTKMTTFNCQQKVRLNIEFRTDLGRSARVTTAIQLVWLTDIRAQPSTPRNRCVIKDTH